jgi:rare lipoprotein A
MAEAATAKELSDEETTSQSLRHLRASGLAGASSGGYVMRTMHTWLAVMGFVGVLLITIPTDGHGGAAPAGQVGWASWYGKQHQGRKTASGERFSREQLTAAHRSLPLGTKVKVTNLRTGQHVVVRVNDRGPYGGGKHRLIDLSEAAAKRIGLMPRGMERVQIVVVENAA